MMRNLYPLLILVLLLGLLSGCSEREDAEDYSGSSATANAALEKAENYLDLAGVKTSFEDPGELSKPEDLVPQPNELASLEKQENLKKAIDQLNIVITELDKEASLAPSAAPIGSLSDRGVVHFYLGLAYVLEAISRLLTSDDPETTFILTYDPNAAMGEWFTYGISKTTKAKLDAVKNPLDYPLVFTEKERQAIIDAVDLISNGIVRPLSPSIQPQSSSVDGPPYIHSAIWHFYNAIDLLSEYAPDLEEPLREFYDQISVFESILHDNAETWGFTYTSALEK